MDLRSDDMNNQKRSTIARLRKELRNIEVELDEMADDEPWGYNRDDLDVAAALVDRIRTLFEKLDSALKLSVGHYKT